MCSTIYLSNNIRWDLQHTISTMMTSHKVQLPFLFLYIKTYMTVDCVSYNNNLFCDISEYVPTQKDNLVIDIARKSPMNTTLVNIDNQFLLQCHMHCLLEPQRYLKDVVSIVLFIQTQQHICNYCTYVMLPNDVF
jgi:hypothetical protein